MIGYTDHIELPLELVLKIEAEAKASPYDGSAGAVVEEAMRCLFAMQDAGAIPRKRALRNLFSDPEFEAQCKISKQCDLGDQGYEWKIWLKEHIHGEHEKERRQLADINFRCLVSEYRQIEYATPTEQAADLRRLLDVLNTMHRSSKSLIKAIASRRIVKSEDEYGRRTIDATLSSIMKGIKICANAKSADARKSAAKARAVSFIFNLIPIYRGAVETEGRTPSSTTGSPFSQMVEIGLSAINYASADTRRLIQEAKHIEKDQNTQFKRN